MTRKRCCDDAIPIEHRFSTIVLLHHRLRVIAPLLSHCRNIASSSMHHRGIAITPMRQHSIDPNLMVRWYDSKLRGPIWIPLQLVKNAKNPDFWIGRDLYRATSAMKRDLGLYGLIRKTAPLHRLLRQARGTEDLIYPDLHGIWVSMNHLCKWE